MCRPTGKTDPFLLYWSTMISHIIRRKKEYLVAFALFLFVLVGVSFRFADSREVPPDDPEPILSENVGSRDIFSDRSPFLMNDPDAGMSDFVSPPPPDMERMKREGCVADRLLTEGFPDQGRTIELVNRSGCYYLHRAVETWLDPPDFEEIDREIAKLRDGFVIGMFLSEAIDVKAEYRYPDEDRNFDFRAMCRPGSENTWGEHTCKPYIAREEYRKYVLYTTQQAMERGVQIFMFGQVHLQDVGDLEASRIPELISEMRLTADHLGMKILIGAQTNDIDRQDYLGLFDFIEGGVGISPEGEIEDGPCFSRWWKQEGDWCWALLWNDRFRSKAKNVFIHYDWSGRIGDDMSTLARMDASTRRKTTAWLHAYFTERDIGFLLPFLTPLPKDNGGCIGPSEHFYTPDDAYSCGDEDAWNDILSGNGDRVPAR